MHWFLLIALLFSFDLPIRAAEPGDPERNIRTGLAKIAPDLEVTGISPTEIDGLYEVILGAEVIYMTGDGRFVLRGELLDLQKQTNVTQSVRTSMRRRLLAEQPAGELIRFSNGRSRHAIYVFTDTDCGYCRKLHQDVPYLNEQGIEVRYLAYPRAGPDSDTFREMEAVWCSDDPRSALTRAKQGEKVQSKSCDNPVAEQYELGRKLGVRGTPAIYLENGRSLPGYVPPKDLLAILNGGG